MLQISETTVSTRFWSVKPNMLPGCDRVRFVWSRNAMLFRYWRALGACIHRLDSI